MSKEELAEKAAQKAAQEAEEADLPDFGEGTREEDIEAIEREFEHDPLDWANVVGQTILFDMGYWAELNGELFDTAGQMYGRMRSEMFTAIYTSLFVHADNRQRTANPMIQREIAQGAHPSEFGVLGMGRDYYTSTVQGQNEMIEYARNWMGNKTGWDLVAAPRTTKPSGRGSGRGRSAQDIRNMFDVNELARGVNNLNRALVLEDHADSKGLARKYVDAVVATGGDKKIDFESFVRDKIEATSRFKHIYARKPESVSAEDYIAPYLGAAMQLASPDEAAGLAIGGAQFGSSAETFRQRLRRTENVTGSAPYINQLEARMSNVSNILRG